MTHRLEASITHLVLIFFAFVSVAPIVGIVIQAFTGPQFGRGWTAGNVARAWGTGQFPTTVPASLVVACGAMALSVTLSTAAGYAFGCLRFRGADALFYFILLGIVVPVEPVLISLYFDMRRLALIDTYAGLILAETMFYLPFGVFWMRAFFRSVPRSLLEAARMDGAGDVRILVAVLLPAARPAVLTLAVLLFVWSWNEFFIPLVLWGSRSVTTATVATGLFTGQRVADIPGAAASCVILSFPVLALYIFMQRHFIRGVLAGSLKG